VSEPRPELFDQAADGSGEPDEVLDAVAVLDPAQARPLEPMRPVGALSPAVQAVAVVGASMMAGAATVAIVQRRRTRRVARRRPRMLAPLQASRSVRVDGPVHGERGK
jgi:hypothetical protein